ncbi:unnamed protein product, partial [Ectocarpus sp. 13 AM-2016]
PSCEDHSCARTPTGRSSLHVRTHIYWVGRVRRRDIMCTES